MTGPLPAAAPTPAPMPSRRILVVEDDPSTRLALRQLLVRRGHAVATAATLAAGLAALADARAEVVLIDLMLPDGSGQELIRAARTAGLAARLVVFSAIAGLAAFPADARPDVVLTKPGPVEALLAAVEADRLPAR